MTRSSSGFNIAAHPKKAGTNGAVKVAHQPSAGESTQLPQVLPRQRKADQSDSAPGYPQHNCLQVLAPDRSFARDYVWVQLRKLIKILLRSTFSR